MAKVIVIDSLAKEIKKKFSVSEADKIADLMQSLEENPYKGKLLTTVGGIVVKELKYNNFRFYFITDGFRLKCLNVEELTDLLLKFVRMSDKKYQQQTINEIKQILRLIGPSGFR